MPYRLWHRGADHCHLCIAGIDQLNGTPLREFFDRRRREIAERLVSDMADTFPALASQIKHAWERIECATES
jgi:hypothetical protein